MKFIQLQLQESLLVPLLYLPEAGSKLAFSFPGTFEIKEKCHVSLVAQMVKNLPAVQETWAWSLGWEKSPGEENSYQLQYSGLNNSMGRGTWQDRVAKSRTWLSDFHFTPFMRAAESLVCRPWKHMAFSLHLAGTTQTTTWLEQVGPFFPQASGTARHQHGCPHYKYTLPRWRGPAPNSNPTFPQIIIIVLLSPAYLFLSFSTLCHS